MNEIEIGGLIIKYNKDVVKIYNSYKINSKSQMLSILITFKIMTNYQSKRNIFSWAKEWKSHNRLYKLGLFKEHTKDCDLEENEKKYRLLIYEILGI